MTADDFVDRLAICVITDDVLGKSFEGPTRGTTAQGNYFCDYPASARVQVASGETFDVEVRKVPMCGCGKLGRWSADYDIYTCCRNLGDGRSA